MAAGGAQARLLSIPPVAPFYVAPIRPQRQGWVEKSSGHVSCGPCGSLLFQAPPQMGWHRGSIPKSQSAELSRPARCLGVKRACAALALVAKEMVFSAPPPFLPPSGANPVNTKGQMNPRWGSID